MISKYIKLHNLEMRHFLRVLASGLISALICFGAFVTIAKAQAADEIWAEPTNLSNSGGGGQPSMVTEWGAARHLGRRI
jgi:hypothetical protein